MEQLNIYVVDDGADNYVSARSESHAVEVVAEFMGMKPEDYDEPPEVELLTDERMRGVKWHDDSGAHIGSLMDDVNDNPSYRTEPTYIGCSEF